MRKHALMITFGLGGIRGIVVERWTVGQQVKRFILHLGHGS